ncbi:unnamed protein product [Linum trigynum]|uniref:Myb/SANT-like domain-containing protein n=1 Tax=Linum trigynum TaxID=586398 RepID=A0AAV2EU93_9ROSI
MGRRKKVPVGEAVKTKYNFWNAAHDTPFVECLLDLTERGLITNGNCKNGVFREIQRMMEKKVPGCGLKSKPTIQNSADNAVWDVFLEQNPTCKTYRDASFPHFFDLAPVFANGRATGLSGFSGNDPEIITEGEDSGSEDDEGHPIPLDELGTSAAEQEMYDLINQGVEDKNLNKNKNKHAAKTTIGGQIEKKKKIQDGGAELASEMQLLRPLIQQSMDIIAKAMGESEAHDNMRKELRANLDKLEGLTRVQRVMGFRYLNANPSDLKSFYEMDDEDRLTLVLSLPPL